MSDKSSVLNLRRLKIRASIETFVRTFCEQKSEAAGNPEFICPRFIKISFGRIRERETEDSDSGRISVWVEFEGSYDELYGARFAKLHGEISALLAQLAQQLTEANGGLIRALDVSRHSDRHVQSQHASVQHSDHTRDQNRL